MDLPVIDPPIFPRWVWIEEITFSHILIATVVNTLVLLAPIFEYIGFKRNDPRFERLAKSFITFSLILFSPGAALGTGIPMWIIGTYPEFWSRWSNLFFWPLIAQFGFFLGEVIFLFFFYYLCWEKLSNRKYLHIFFGALAALFSLAVQVVWDALGSYMTTPAVALPAVNEPVAWSAAAFFNPSFGFLFWHRFFGNLSYVMLLTGGVFAIASIKVKDEGERKYYSFASGVTFSLGFLAFFAMPLIGWGYAKVIQQHAPVVFHAIMGGHVSPHFTVKMLFIAAMVMLGAVYLFSKQEQKWQKPAISLGLGIVLLVFYLHPPLTWLFNSKTVWLFAVPVAILSFLFFLWKYAPRLQGNHVFWQWSKLVVGLLALSTFFVGGFVRERSRSPYTVYKEIVKPEMVEKEADRFLFYDRCLGCHLVSDISGYEKRDWRRRVAVERKRPGINLSDNEAERVILFLEDSYR